MSLASNMAAVTPTGWLRLQLGTTRPDDNPGSRGRGISAGYQWYFCLSGDEPLRIGPVDAARSSHAFSQPTGVGESELPTPRNFADPGQSRPSSVKAKIKSRLIADLDPERMGSATQAKMDALAHV